MNSTDLQNASNSIQAADLVFGQQAAQITQLQQQLDSAMNNPKLIFPAVQLAPWELLWGVGRSHPVNNPPVHGTATMTPGEPAAIDYHPASLPNDRDNLYCLRRLGPYVPVDQLQAATKFTYGITIKISDVTAPQAFELDFQRQVGTKVWNMGYQFLAGSPLWQVRAFDYTNKAWKALPGITINPALLAPGQTLTVFAEFTNSDTSESHDALTINGARTAINFAQPVFTAKTSINAFNVAVQLDANAQAKPWTAWIGMVTPSLF